MNYTAHTCICVRAVRANTWKHTCHRLVKWLPRRMLSMSASWEFVILCPQRQREGRAGPVDRELMMLGNHRPMWLKQLDSLLVPISGSIKPSKGPHSGLCLGGCWLQNNQIVPGGDWLASEKRDEVKEKCSPSENKALSRTDGEIVTILNWWH